MYDQNVLHRSRMARSTPSPEELGDRAPRSKNMVSFRLSDPEYEALLALAEKAGIGHSALARRIVEHYINEHAPRNRRGR
jgi:hypothetical protein